MWNGGSFLVSYSSNGLAPLLEFGLGYFVGLGQVVAINVVGAGDHADKVATLPDLVDHGAHQEPVPEGLEPLVGHGQFVGRRQDAPHLHAHVLLAVSVNLFVQYGEQRVLDRRARLPDLVQEHDVGPGQVVIGQPLVLVLVLQFFDRDRAKYFVGGAKLVHQVLKRLAVAEGELQAAGQQALGHARRAEQEQALARHGREQRQPDGFFFFVNSFGQLLENVLDFFADRHAKSTIVGWCTSQTPGQRFLLALALKRLGLLPGLQPGLLPGGTKQKPPAAGLGVLFRPKDRFILPVPCTGRCGCRP